MTNLSQLAEEYYQNADDLLNHSRQRAFLSGAHAVLKCPEVVAMREALERIVIASDHSVPRAGMTSSIAGEALAAFEKLVKECGE